MIHKILIGTNNLHKMSEIRAIIPEFEFVTPAELGIQLDVDETGSTFAENAALKAHAFCKASGLTTLADDSGLEVDLLGGAPGVHSHRYCPLPGATDADRRAFLLKNLNGKPQPWKAKFRSAAAICFPENETVTILEGECNGEVLPEERGSNGFGYDALFYFPKYGKTLAEMSDTEKNQISHRKDAMRKVRDFLIRRAKDG